ncbi:hypothetical protein H2204_007583 [Knufia peltigerae]|nr:hypothetical protein H2204_007583 [Knufia peltigerae]
MVIASPAPMPQEGGSPETSTVPGVSQISDGQIQATATTMSSYENPFTMYTTETNSLGVITGMPSVVTSQPSVVTSQPASPTLPSYSGYVYANSTSASSQTTMTGGQNTTLTGSMSATTMATSTASGSGSGGASSASPTFAQATGGAVSNKVAGAGIGLVVMGLGFSLL